MNEQPENQPGIVPHSSQLEKRTRQDDLVRDPDLFRKMLDNQASELELRNEELELRKREQEATRQYAEKALEMQAQDRREDRTFHRGLSAKLFGFLITVLLIVVAGFCYALYLNKDQVVMEIVKAVVYLGAGGVGGYSAKSIKVAKEEKEEDDEY